MWRTGMCRFGVGNWIFLFACLHLFTYAQGGEDPTDPGVRFTTEPADAVLAPGEAALLPCSVASRRAIRLAWRHSVTAPPTRDHAITDTDKYRKQLPNGSLSITDMSGALAGHYQCVATVDGVGTILSRVATLFLAEVPELVGGARSVLGTVGGAALLTCGVRAPPRLALRLLSAAPPDRKVYGAARLHNAPPLLKLNVTWLKNGQPIRMESTRMWVTPSGALELEPLRHHDAAVYACRVSLAHAPTIYKVSAETELRVSAEPASAESPPRFIATPPPLTVMEGASVTFDCAAVGNPKPEMSWLNNGAAIDLSDLDSRFYLVGSGSLRVQSARALDAGAYTCRAHNRLDSADHTTQLHVLTPPRVTLPGGAVVTARARGDVTLRCEARGRPAPNVAWLKDGDPLTPNNHDIALVDGSSLRIQGVLRVDAGMFQCVASSAAGQAAAGLRLRVLPPDDELTNITIDSTGHDILTTDVDVDPTPDEPDFLGETSSAYTSGPEVEYDEDYTDDDGTFHAAKGLDLERADNGSSVSAPRGLTAVIVKHRFVTLSWQPPQHVEGELTGYAVVYRVNGSERERVSRGGAGRHEMNVASLQPNTTYQFAVRAHTDRATSPPSESIWVRTAEEEVSHGPPVALRGEPAGPHALRLAWRPPAPPADPPPTKYSIHYTEVESGREQFQWVEADPSATTISSTVSGLRAASAYVVRVAAAGGAPAELRLRTPSDAPAAPPANVTVVATSATSILVRWEAPPARTHRGPLTGYKVRYRAAAPDAGPAAGPAQPAAPRRKADSLTTPADQKRAELRGLDTATTYQIRVCAINANGSGPFSEWVSASTQRHELDESRVPPPPPPLTTRAGRDWISVWWGEEAGGVVVRGYVLGWGLGVPDDAARDLPAHLHSHVIRGLESNAEYVISLRASNSRGLGPAVYATVRTRPPADDDAEPDDEDDDDEEIDEPPPLIPPVGVKVIMLSGTTAVVYWTDPTLPKGQVLCGICASDGDGRAALRGAVVERGRARAHLQRDRPQLHAGRAAPLHAVRVRRQTHQRRSRVGVVDAGVEHNAGGRARVRAARPAARARAAARLARPRCRPHLAAARQAQRDHYWLRDNVRGVARRRGRRGVDGGGGAGRAHARAGRAAARAHHVPVQAAGAQQQGAGALLRARRLQHGARRARRPGLRHLRLAVGQRGRRLRRAGAGRRARALALLPPLAAAAVARHQHIPEVVGVGGHQAAGPVDPPRPDGAEAHGQVAAQLRHLGGQRGGRRADVVDADAGARAARRVRAGAPRAAAARLARPPPPRAHLRRVALGVGGGVGRHGRAARVAVRAVPPLRPLRLRRPPRPARPARPTRPTRLPVQTDDGHGRGRGVRGHVRAAAARAHAAPRPEHAAARQRGPAGVAAVVAGVPAAAAPAARALRVRRLSAGRGVLGAGAGRHVRVRHARCAGAARHVRLRGARARTLRRLRAARPLHAPRLAEQRGGGRRGRLAAAARRGARAAQLRAGRQRVRPLHAHARARAHARPAGQRARHVAVQEERQLLARTHPQQAAARRCGGSLPVGAGAADAVALHRATASRDAEPGGADEGPVRHHAAAVPLLAPPLRPPVPAPAALHLPVLIPDRCRPDIIMLSTIRHAQVHSLLQLRGRQN